MKRNLLLLTIITIFCASSFSAQTNQSAYLEIPPKSIDLGDAENQCITCFKTYSTSSNLRTHIRTIHDQIKNHKCPKCDKAFGQSQHLTRHIRAVHDKIKDLQCPHCDKAFGLSQHLKRHIKRKHPLPDAPPTPAPLTGEDYL